MSPEEKTKGPQPSWRGVGAATPPSRTSKASTSAPSARQAALARWSSWRRCRARCGISGSKRPHTAPLPLPSFGWQAIVPVTDDLVVLAVDTETEDLEQNLAAAGVVAEER